MQKRTCGYSFCDGRIVAHGDERAFSELKTELRDIIERVLVDPFLFGKTLYFGVSETWFGRVYEIVWFTFDGGCYGEEDGFHFTTWGSNIRICEERVHRMYCVYTGERTKKQRKNVSKCLSDISQKT
ncbi:hypothetical protein A9K97_gp253 [Tokyovirus A1]|uniref:hypothetical protein n=1 Tax=Tokyovirus A1 TaxID=1826170 RepID=UPI0007A96495|nr:hypothetical protein A9K97_gp253 [Tokyovirus A1]BAU80098.1 hypothetical protein [Tokyovirus A1]